MKRDIAIIPLTLSFIAMVDPLTLTIENSKTIIKERDTSGIGNERKRKTIKVGIRNGKTFNTKVVYACPRTETNNEMI